MIDVNVSTANKTSLYVDKSNIADFAQTASIVENVNSSSMFSEAGTLAVPSLNIIGGGVTGSLSTSVAGFVTASKEIDTIPINSGNSVKWFVFIDDGISSRANKVVASWNNSSSMFYSTQFNEIGNVPVNFSVSSSMTNIYLKAIPLSGSWTMKFIRIMI
jgi:hypothetical protein